MNQPGSFGASFMQIFDFIFNSPKPRIKWHPTGVWVCFRPDFNKSQITGKGATPKEAYDDWMLGRSK